VGKTGKGREEISSEESELESEKTQSRAIRFSMMSAAAMNFQKLLGAFWLNFLRRLLHIWGRIPVLQAQRLLHTQLANA